MNPRRIFARGRVGPESRVSGIYGNYVGLLEGLAAAQATPEKTTAQSDQISDWRARMFALNKRQRAYGSVEQLKAWTTARGLRCLENALPA